MVAAGEQVLDVPPKLAARVRLLQAGDMNNNDPQRCLVGGGRGAAVAGQAPGARRGPRRRAEGGGETVGRVNPVLIFAE
jgi:hypothetical protein